VFTLGSAKDSSGIIYFASTDNLLRFDPKDISNKESGASLQLLSVTVNNRIVDITNKQKLNLKPGENTIRFEFDVLDFDNPAGHYILCKLENYDKNWLLLQDVFQQTYRSLPGGSYTFRLKKVNADGFHSKEITLPITIADYFYNTTWFRILAVILIGLLIFTGVRVYVNRKLQKQKVILEKKQAIELERLRISAELHDDIGGELSAIRLLSEMAQMNKTENPQQQFEKISASSSDLVQKMNEIVWALNVNNDTLQSLISYVQRYAVRYLDDVGIECKFTQPETIPKYEVDGAVRRNIFLMVKEALNNIVKHASATCVFMRVEINYQLEILIHDNGKGIEKENLTANTGNGLSTMQKRAKDLKGAMQITNHNGTTIVFLIPLKETHTKV
jgi:signal transduction histidine kinase